MRTKSRFVSICLFTVILLIGGVIMGYSQEKPPLLGNPSENKVPVSSEQNPPILQQTGVPSPPLPSGNPTIQPPPPGAVPPPPVSPTYANTKIILEKIGQALETAKQARKYFNAGKVWTTTAPRGEIEIKGAILYQGAVVAVVQFDPISGEPLPRGYHVISSSSKVSLEFIHQMLDLVVKQLEAMNGAEYREPEYCYVVPLVYKGRIVAEVKIYYDGIHIVPDYRAQEEMNAFGK